MDPMKQYDTDVLISKQWLPWCRDRLAQLEERGVQTEVGRCYVKHLRHAIDVAERRIAGGKAPAV